MQKKYKHLAYQVGLTKQTKTMTQTSESHEGLAEALRLIQDCHADAYWRGYSDKIRKLSLPMWAFKSNNFKLNQ